MTCLFSAEAEIPVNVKATRPGKQSSLGHVAQNRATRVEDCRNSHLLRRIETAYFVRRDLD